MLHCSPQWHSELYRRWKFHAASEFGKRLVRSGLAFPKGRQRHKGEKERRRDRVPGKPKAREGSRNRRNGRLDARHADGERGEKAGLLFHGFDDVPLGRDQAKGLCTSTLRE